MVGSGALPGFRGGLQPAVLRGRLHLPRWLRLQEGPSGAAEDPRAEVRVLTTSSPRSFVRRWTQGLREPGIEDLHRRAQHLRAAAALWDIFDSDPRQARHTRVGRWDQEDALTWRCLRESL